MTKQIINKYGDKVLVNWDTKKLVAFSNKNKKIEYNVAKVTDSDITYYTDVVVDGVVTDIVEKLNCDAGPVKQLYAKVVGYNSTNNDPEKTLWNKILDYCQNNENDFFDTNGDFKLFNSKEQKNLIKIFECL